MLRELKIFAHYLHFMDHGEDWISILKIMFFIETLKRMTNDSAIKTPYTGHAWLSIPRFILKTTFTIPEESSLDWKMGTCCCGNKPSERFVGTWTDYQQVELTIGKNGSINYQKKVFRSIFSRWRKILFIFTFRHRIVRRHSAVQLVLRRILSSTAAVAVVFVEIWTIQVTMTNQNWSPME